MRVILVTVAAALALPSAARAETVLVMGPDAAGELGAAMRVVMAGRGTEVASVPAPAGGVRLERAAAAQRAAAQSGAEAAVWIDGGEVCAVTPDGRDFRHAPYPPEAASARAFAAIAASLVDEMVGPAPWGVDVTVDVQVRSGGTTRVATAAPMAPGAAIAAPGTIVVDVAAPPVRAHAGRTLVEVGPMLTPMTYGLEGGVAFSLAPDWRVAATAAVNRSFDKDFNLALGLLELRHIGAGLERHWDIGALAGWAEPDQVGSAAFAGLRIARTYEVGSSAVSLSLSPVLVHANDSGDTPLLFPAVWGSVRWQLAL